MTFLQQELLDTIAAGFHPGRTQESGEGETIEFRGDVTSRHSAGVEPGRYIIARKLPLGATRRSAAAGGSRAETGAARILWESGNVSGAP
jgi:hypothetical protein